MSFRIKTAALTAGLALVAVPAYGAGQQPTATPPGYNGSNNPGTQQQPTTVPPGYNGTSNPGTQNANTNASGPNGNAGNTSQPSNPHALAVQQCAAEKTNFKENKSAFGKCVSAVQLSLITNASPSQACRSKRLSRTKHDGQARSDFKACVLAARKAQQT
jgi:hypothetical protein